MLTKRKQDARRTKKSASSKTAHGIKGAVVGPAERIGLVNENVCFPDPSSCISRGRHLKWTSKNAAFQPSSAPGNKATTRRHRTRIAPVENVASASASGNIIVQSIWLRIQNSCYLKRLVQAVITFPLVDFHIASWAPQCSRQKAEYRQIFLTLCTATKKHREPSC